MDRGLSMSLSTDEDRGERGRVMVCPVILTKPCGGGLKGAGVSDAAVCQLCLSRANYHPDLLYGNRPTTVNTSPTHCDPHKHTLLVDSSIEQKMGCVKISTFLLIMTCISGISILSHKIQNCSPK